MPFYDYVCEDCVAKILAESDGQAVAAASEDAVFETRYSINATPAEIAEATRCPRCSSSNTRQVFDKQSLIVMVRGCNWHEYFARNRGALRREMSLFQLTGKDPDTGASLDPYGEHRVPGEADDLAHRLEKSKLKQTETKTFVGGACVEGKSD